MQSRLTGSWTFLQEIAPKTTINAGLRFVENGTISFSEESQRLSA
jgi:hypothetical protein